MNATGMMRVLLLAAAAPLAMAAPAHAQADPHAGHDMADMPGMAMPPAKPAAAETGATNAGRTAKKPAGADGHAGHAMHGMKKGADAIKASPADDPHAGHTMQSAAGEAQASPASDPHAGHTMPSMAGEANAKASPAGDPHAGHTMPATAGEAGAAKASPASDPHAGHTMPGMDMGGGAPAADAVGTALEPGDAPAPPPPADRWADRYYDTAEMTRARDITRREHGGGTFSQILFNLAELQVRNGRDGYRWDGEGWFGGDINRLTVKTEGEGDLGGGVEAAEVQALWSHALDPYWNLQAGARLDLDPGPARTYATIGVEGLAPYWFEVEGALFLSDQGDLLGRAEAWYDQRITQRLVLQPRVELNFAAQDVAANRIGAGLVNAELGLRLRYEIAREFAPYVGVSWERRTGATARLARAAGDGASETGLVAGVRFWF